MSDETTVHDEDRDEARASASTVDSAGHFEVRVPDLGPLNDNKSPSEVNPESNFQVTVGGWEVDVGKPFKEGTILTWLELGKASMDVLAPRAGVLVRQVKRSGDPVVPGEVIAVIDVGGAPTIPSYT